MSLGNLLKLRHFIRAGLLNILLLVFCGSAAAAGFDTFRFDNWTTDSGLPQNSVLSIIQSRDGYLWFTTFDGLVRFDGVKFTVFNKNNTKNILSNRFVSVFEDAEGAIWSGTDDGRIFCYRNGEFQAVGVDGGLLPGAVWGISQSSGGEIIASTVLNEILQSYLLKENRFEPIPVADSVPVRRIYRGASGTSWVQDARGVHETKNGSVTHYPVVLKNDTGFAEDKGGALWLGDKSGFYRLNDGQVTRIDNQGASLVKGELLLTEPNPAIYIDNRDYIWSGNERLAILDPKTEKIAEIPAADHLAYIKTITGDREGNVWIGTNGNGLTRASRKFITTYSVLDGMQSENIYPLFEDSLRNVWVGVGGIVKITNGRVTNVDEYDALGIGSPQSFHEDRTGGIWVGGSDGIACYKNGKFTDLTPTFGRRSYPAISEDKAGNLWLGAYNGLLKYKDGVITAYTTESGLPGSSITDIYEDERGVMWFATGGGLAKYENDSFTSYTEKDGLAGDHLRTITGEPDGTLWLGTYDNGLSRFKNGVFTNYNTSNGLFNDGVFRILDDGRGNFWMSCNRGIYRVAKQQLNDYADGRISAVTSVAYGKDDGMLSTEANGGRKPAGFKAHDGKLWFPTQKGVVVIDPQAITFNAQPPPVVIEKIKIDNNEVALSSSLNIEPGQSIVEIAYAGLSLIKSEQVRFKYKIEGLDKDWIDAGTRRSAYYSYLPAGEYRFTVIASNADGVWNEQGASLKIKVLPPFWKTWWFYGLVVLVCLIAAYLFYRRRTRQLTRERQAQELMSRRLIESQEEERKRLAGELHDSLSQNLVIIKNRAMMTLADREDTESAFEQIEEIAEAASETLAEVRDIAYRLRPFQIDRLGLTEAIEVMIKKISNGHLAIERKLDKIDGLLSPELEINFYRIVQESLNNIVKHSQASRAGVIIRHEEQAIQLSISDNGRGFDAGEMLRKESAGASGFGLMSVFERARILGAIPRIESTENGTTIYLNILL